ncbi:MAG: hypothetical protein ACOX7D_00935 [Alphaproteobacteria bacterium]|jgi:hypothetical protein
MKINLKYLSETWRKFSQFSKHQISTSILKIQEIEQATIMPHQPNIKIGIPQKVRGVRIRKYGQQSANYIDKEVILLGAADPFFGHFLADGLSRAWPILDKKFINYTFVVVQGRGGVN